MSLKDIIEALCFVLDVCRKYYFVPGKVENWVIFLELNHGGIFDFPTKVSFSHSKKKLFIEINPHLKISSLINNRSLNQLMKSLPLITHPLWIDFS